MLAKYDLVFIMKKGSLLFFDRVTLNRIAKQNKIYQLKFTYKEKVCVCYL